MKKHMKKQWPKKKILSGKSAFPANVVDVVKTGISDAVTNFWRQFQQHENAERE